MVSSGFDPQGAMRLHQRMMEAGKAAPIAFLSTHPSGEERTANIREIIANLQGPVRTAAWPHGLDKKDVGELMRRGNWYGLLALSDEQTIRDPTDAFWWFHKGFAYQRLGNHSEAVSAYLITLKHQPDYRSAASNLGFSYIQLKQPEKAAAAFDDAIRVTPDHGAAWFGLGIAYHPSVGPTG